MLLLLLKKMFLLLVLLLCALFDFYFFSVVYCLLTFPSSPPLTTGRAQFSSIQSVHRYTKRAVKVILSFSCCCRCCPLLPMYKNSFCSLFYRLSFDYCLLVCVFVPLDFSASAYSSTPLPLPLFIYFIDTPFYIELEKERERESYCNNELKERERETIIM